MRAAKKKDRGKKHYFLIGKRMEKLRFFTRVQYLYTYMVTRLRIYFCIMSTHHRQAYYYWTGIARARTYTCYRGFWPHPKWLDTMTFKSNYDVLFFPCIYAFYDTLYEQIVDMTMYMCVCICVLCGVRDRSLLVIIRPSPCHTHTRVYAHTYNNTRLSNN